MKNVIKFLAITLLATVYSCGQKQELGEIAAHSESINSGNAVNIEAPENNFTVERKIIKEGEICFETASLSDTRALIDKTVSDTKGYISKDNIFDYSNRIEHQIIIRVPADKFDLLLDKISQSASKLDSKNIRTLDVTEEFIDIEARIKTKKELEDRYKELLKQANKVDEILTIEKEIGALRTEIESIEGRLTYLKSKVSYSTLTVVFYEKTSSSFGFNSKMGQAIHNGWTNLLWFFVTATNLWPFIVISIIIFFIYKQYKKRKSLKTK